MAFFFQLTPRRLHMLLNSSGKKNKVTFCLYTKTVWLTKKKGITIYKTCRSNITNGEATTSDFRHFKIAFGEKGIGLV